MPREGQQGHILVAAHAQVEVGWVNTYNWQPLQWYGTACPTRLR